MSQSHLANDRTFLAWLRTTIALFGLGFVVAKVSFLADPDNRTISDARLYTGVGVFIVLCGAAVMFMGYRQHTSVTAYLNEEEGEGPPPPSWVKGMTLGTLAGGLVLATLIIVTS